MAYNVGWLCHFGVSFFVEEVNKNEKLLLPLRFKYSVVN